MFAGRLSASASGGFGASFTRLDGAFTKPPGRTHMPGYAAGRRGRGGGGGGCGCGFFHFHRQLGLGLGRSGFGFGFGSGSRLQRAENYELHPTHQPKKFESGSMRDKHSAAQSAPPAVVNG